MQSDDLGLEDLISEYWDLAYMEGASGRTTDTPASDAQRVRSAISAAIERLVAERDEALAQSEWWKKCGWWEGGQHDYHRSRATRLEAGLLKLRPGGGTDAERLAAIEQETGLSFTPKLQTHLDPHPAEAQRDEARRDVKIEHALFLVEAEKHSEWLENYMRMKARADKFAAALIEISSPTQTEKLLWWQERARQALGDTL